MPIPPDPGSSSRKTKKGPRIPITVLKDRLKEAEETLSAIQRGEVDAVVVDSPNGKKVYTLQGADHLYRVLIQEMHDAAIIISDSGLILFCNQYFSDMVKTPLTTLIGSPLSIHIVPEDRDDVGTLYETLNSRGLKREVRFLTGDGSMIPTTASFIRIQEANGICVVATDLSVQKRIEDQLRREYRSAQAEILTSQKKYQALTETILDFIWETDVEGKYTYCSPQMEKLWGLKPEKMIGKTPFDMMPPEAKERGMDMFRRMGELPVMFTDLETTGYDSQGHLIYLETNGVPFFDDHGKLSGYRGVTRDITERKCVEGKLRESEERFRSLAENAPSVLQRFDRQKRVVYLSPLAAEITGMPIDTFMGKTNREIGMPDDLCDLWEGAMEEVFHTGQNRDVEFDIMTPKGKRTFFLRFAPEKAEDGSVTHVLGISTDITERKRTENSLRRSWTILRTALERMSDAVFISDVNGQFIEYNDAFVTFHRFKDRAECSKNIYDYPPILEVWFTDTGVSASPEQWAVSRALRGETASNVEYTLRRKDTGETWIGTYNFAPIRDENDSIIGSVVTARDITERKKAEGALQKSEERFRELAEKAGSIILRFDTAGRITYFNEFAEKFFGFSRDEIIGKPAVGTIIPATESTSDRDLDAMVRDIVARPDQYAENENENIKKNGERVWIRWTNKPVFNADGTIREFNTIGIDITDRKKTEDALRELMARYELILEGAHTALWDWDVRHKTVVYSPQWKALRGYGEDEISNQDDEWSKGIHPDDFPRVMSAIKEHFEGNTPVFAMEYRVHCKDGSWRWIFDRGIAKRDAQGVVVRMAGSEEDITERKATEEKIQQYVENLKRSNEDLERFAYIASHDLQEPLRNVVSFSQLLSRRYQGKLSTDADEYIGYIIEGGKRMQVLVQDLLEYSRVNTRGRAFETVRCDEIIDQALQNLQTTIQENDAAIERDPLPKVLGDPSQLTLVFQNLIGNGIKFRRRGLQPHIRISADRTGDCWTFAIKDNGIGIDSAYYDRIFVIFQRLHGWNEYPGTGVGLAIVKKIIERHGGRIWVESTMGDGSTFYFTLPAVPTQKRE